MASPNELSKYVLDSAIKIHKALGPGLLESAYKTCLKHELEKLGLTVNTEVIQPTSYDGIKLSEAFRLDLLVEGKLIVELKSVAEILPIHKMQLLTYLKLSHLRLGLLLNFNTVLLKNGIVRIIN